MTTMKVMKNGNLISIGGAAQLLGATVDEVDQAADELGLIAVIALHGVPYICEETFENIQRHIERKRASVRAAKTSKAMQN
jgi:hypothetical protein